jgi:hypothetical protein
MSFNVLDISLSVEILTVEPSRYIELLDRLRHVLRWHPETPE